jgi:pimeloyl-ACP methyl ester carboxylesterase
MIKELKAKGLRISYRQQGTGDPLVLLHGALSDSRIWKRQFEEFSKDFLVVAWDAPGCGRSSDPPVNFRLSDFADCLAEAIDKLNLEHPHILGLSFGSGLALEFYRRYPEIPGSLILASAYAGWAGSLPPETVADRLQKGLEQSILPAKEVVETWLPSLFNESVPTDVINETADIMKDFHPAGMRVMLRAFAEADLRDVLPHIKVPSLLLYGDADQRSPLKIARELHASIPTSKLVIMPGIGHVIQAEAPEKFNVEVLSFLKSIKNE